MEHTLAPRKSDSVRHLSCARDCRASYFGMVLDDESNMHPEFQRLTPRSECPPNSIVCRLVQRPVHRTIRQGIGCAKNTHFAAGGLSGCVHERKGKRMVQKMHRLVHPRCPIMRK